MKEGVIITRPDYDDVTKAFFDFTKEIKHFAKYRSVPVKEINEPNVTKDNFGKILSGMDYSFVFLNGHGNDSSVVGSGGEIILSDKINFSEFGNRICYCRACQTGKELGPKLVSGGGAFIGYAKPFEFYVSTKNISSPLRDPMAKLFLKPSNIIPKTLLKGKSIKEASERGKKAILKNIKKIVDNNNYSLQMAVTLWKNYRN